MKKGYLLENAILVITALGIIGIIIVLIILALSARDRHEQERNNLPQEPPIHIYSAVIVSGGESSGHDIIVKFNATRCDATYRSEVFDGRKTPLIYIICYIGGRWEYDYMTSAYFPYRRSGESIAFEGLVDSYAIVEELSR